MIAEALLKNLSTSERAELLQALREELSRSPELISVPDWHLEVLAERRRVDEAGESTWLDLEQVQRNLDAWRRSRA